MSGRASPSAEMLLGGEATGEVTFNPDGAPPAPAEPVDDWLLIVQLARFSELENGLDGFEIILTIEANKGAMLDLWLTTPEGPVARWQGGPTDTFGGVACFQLPLVDLEDESVVMQLDPDQAYSLSADLNMAGQVLASDQIDVTHFVPRLEGTAPGPDSMVFRDLLGCRRTGK